MNRVRSARTIAGLAVAVAVAVAVADPGTAWTWAAFATVYVLVEAGAFHRPGAGWIAALAAGTALDPRSAVVVFGAAALALAVGDSSSPRRLAIQVAASIAPLLVPAFVIGDPAATSPAVLGLVGAAAGVSARLAKAADDWTRRTRTTHPAAHRVFGLEVAESAFLGGTAGLIGALVASVGGIAVPVALAAVLVLVATDVARLDLLGTRVGAVRSLLTALEAKDLYTRGHAERVARYARFTARHMGLSRRRTDRLELAALLHDIGKIAVPRHLLRKRGRLTDDEYCRVQYHAEVVPEMLAPIGFLAPVVPIIGEHHVHFDGGGYGAGAGHAVSLEARILAVADSFDAMTSHRSYRVALSWDYAIGELRRCSGTQFDPEVVDAFVTALAAMGRSSDAAGLDSDEEARRLAEEVLVHA
jgi:HD-GYP domain-containing protein (c-di-GMP phosphodiesterase class II)